MMKYLIKIYNFLKKGFEKNQNFLHLKSIKKTDDTIFCEFNEMLRLDGNLIKFNIDEIANNPNIQQSISPKTLFIIGVVYGKYLNSLTEFRIKIIDIKNNLVTLENSSEKIIIAIDELIYDESLIHQVNQADLVRLLCQYIYRLGYTTRFSLDNNNINTSKNNSTQTDYANSQNIINLF